MRLYRYKAISASGEVLNGEVEANNRGDVINLLNDKGLLPIEALAVGAEARRPAFRLASWSLRAGKQPLNNKQLTEMTRELSNMIGAGVSLERALEILNDISETPEVRHVIELTLASVREGKLFSEALAEQNFSPLYVSLVHAGEVGGALGQVLSSLADYLGRMQTLRANIFSALAYPSIVLSLAISALFLLLVFVIPQFEQMFVGAEEKIPFATKIVMDVSVWLQEYWHISLVSVGVFVVLWSRVRRLDNVAIWLDRLWLKMPAIGTIIAKVEAARFCRTLGILLKNGVPMLAALKSVRAILGNRVMSRAVRKIPGRIQAGDNLSTPLIEEPEFPRLAVHMIRVGEETGRLNQMLVEVADIYDQEVERSIRRFLAIIEPLLILVLGILVGGVIISVLVGILSINELAF